MKRATLLLLLSASCVQQAEAPPRTLASFDVKLDLSAAPQPPTVVSTCTFGSGENERTDLCPGLPGNFDAFIPYPGERFAQVRLDIRAIPSDRTSADDTTTFPLTGPVSIGLRAGDMDGNSRQVNLVDGVAEDVVVRFRRTPGPTYLWVVDDLPRLEEGARPTFAAGWSDVPLFFGQPKIADIQKDDAECCSPLAGQRVDITDGQLYVTRVTGNGFNVQDLTTPEWGGLFVFAFNGIEGLRTGTRLLSLAGGITEFQGSTQLTEPIFTPINGLCAPLRAANEGGIDVSDDESGAARVRCPRGSKCLQDDEGIDRCTPDLDPSLDEVGRKVCTLGGAECPSGTECVEITGQGTFCQVAPLPMNPEAFPEMPYCGPNRTDFDLTTEALEGSLVELTSSSPLGVRLGGLPVCRKPDGADPLHQVRSSCNLVDADKKPVDLPDCTLAEAGDTILRDAQGSPCFRHNQACKDEGMPSDELQSTCNPDETKQRCATALPGEPVLRNEDGTICRATLDDFVTSGYFDFGQVKAVYEDETGLARCATLNFDGLTNFDAIDVMERGDLWEGVRGTLRQVRFSSGATFWVIDVRYAEDLLPLTAE
jgi:hypothetical protein